MDKRLNRQSPPSSATGYPVGHKKKGNDGNMWKIVLNKNGVKRWNKINTRRKSRRRKRKSHKKKINMEKNMNKYENIDKISIKNFKGLWKPQTKPINKMTKTELIKEIKSFRDAWQKYNTFAFLDQDTERLNKEDLNGLKKLLKYNYSDENKKLAAETLHLI